MLESGNPAIFASGVSVDPTLPTGTPPYQDPTHQDPGVLEMGSLWT